MNTWGEGEPLMERIHKVADRIYQIDCKTCAARPTWRCRSGFTGRIRVWPHLSRFLARAT